MKWTLDNQINTSFIDISRIKWQFFLLRLSFFRTTRPLASSEATAYYQPAPGRTDSVPERHQRQWIWIRLYKFLAGTSKEQVLDKGIRQKSTKEWTHSLTAVPFVRGHWTVSPRTPRNTCVYTRHPAQCHGHVWCVDMAPGQTHKKRNAC